LYHSLYSSSRPSTALLKTNIFPIEDPPVSTD
jgi:hypothetical protein